MAQTKYLYSETYNNQYLCVQLANTQMPLDIGISGSTLLYTLKIDAK